jgi:hypothetical protein
VPCEIPADQGIVMLTSAFAGYSNHSRNNSRLLPGRTPWHSMAYQTLGGYCTRSYAWNRQYAVDVFSH